MLLRLLAPTCFVSLWKMKIQVTAVILNKIHIMY